jgi:hypothetical protein
MTARAWYLLALETDPDFHRAFVLQTGPSCKELMARSNVMVLIRALRCVQPVVESTTDYLI